MSDPNYQDPNYQDPSYQDPSYRDLVMRAGFEHAAQTRPLSDKRRGQLNELVEGYLKRRPTNRWSLSQHEFNYVAAYYPEVKDQLDLKPEEPANPPQPWVSVVYIHKADRLTNTRSGNPRWMLTFSSAEDDDSRMTVYTDPDSQFASMDLSALVGFKVYLSVHQHLVTAIRPTAMPENSMPPVSSNTSAEDLLHLLNQAKQVYQQVPIPTTYRSTTTPHPTIGRFSTP